MGGFVFLRSLIALFFIPVLLFAEGRGPLQQPTNATAHPDFVWFDANRIGAWISNEGEFTSFRKTGNPGMEWPLGSSKTINFQSGLWIAGLVDSVIHTAVAEFTTEFRSGTYESYPDSPDSVRYRIYAIDFLSGPGDEDWDNWPAADGAPVDSNGDPLLLGDKTYWSVFHDADTAAHLSPFNTDPLGIEVRMTVWGYDDTGILGDVMYLNFQIFNKGDNFIEDAYLALWHDVDLGFASDDLIGTDTLLQMLYVYNNSSDGVYGANAPAIGFGLLQGPAIPSLGDTAIYFGDIIPNHANAGMYASSFFIGGGPAGTSDPETANQAYYNMQGLNGLGQAKFDNNGDSTRYAYTGDPVTGDGWINTHDEDLRGLASYGPFDMAPGDSNEIRAAVVIAQDSSSLESVAKLRKSMMEVRVLQGLPVPNYPPFLNLNDLAGVLSGETEILWSAADFEDSTLFVSIEYSNDAGENWVIVADDLPNSGSYLWDTWVYPNSETSLIALSTSDGDKTVRVVSELFEIRNQRQMFVEHVFSNVIGNGQGPMVLNVVDSPLLTNHNYTLSFRESSDTGELVYDIFDVDDGILKLSGVTETSGREGPAFDGIRLTMFNFDDTVAWKTNWTKLIGDTSSYKVDFLKGRDLSDDDYEVRFLGEGADTTFTGTMIPFQIWNLDVVPQKKVMLHSSRTEWQSGTIFLFLEDDIRTWSVRFRWGIDDTPPQEGDVLKLYSGRPHHVGDLLLFNIEGAPIGIELDEINLPLTFELSQNYPNPFNPVTRIEYSLPVSSEVLLVIYNLRGQEVARLIDGEQPAGLHTATWNASNVSSGIYFYRIQASPTSVWRAGDFVLSRKMVLLK